MKRLSLHAPVWVSGLLMCACSGSQNGISGSVLGASSIANLQANNNDVSNLTAGTTLTAPQALKLGTLSLNMQSDGNFVLYQSGKPVWATSNFPGYDVQGFQGPTEGLSCSGCTAAFQGDGNLVLYFPDGKPYWASSTSGNPNAVLNVSTAAPFLSIVSASNSVLWQPLAEGLVLYANQSVQSGDLTFVMQADGNLVLYKGKTPLWGTSQFQQNDASGFSGPTDGMSCSNCYAAFQTDGNLVLYAPSTNYNPEHSYWASNTSGNSGAILQVLENSPYVAIVNSSLVNIPFVPTQMPNQNYITTHNLFGQGVFWNKKTNSNFVPRAVNYIHVQDCPHTNYVCLATWDPGVYQSSDAENSLAMMQSQGFNIVRMTLDTIQWTEGWGLTSRGLSQAYMSNVIDFISRAKNHGLLIELAIQRVPYNYPKSAQNGISGNANYFFNDSFETARGEVWSDVLAEIEDYGLLSQIFSADLFNEPTVNPTTDLPFSGTGNFSFWGKNWNMNSDSDRETLLVAGTMDALDKTAAVVRSVAPGILLTASTYSPYAVGLSGYNGVKGNLNYPAMVNAIFWSDVDYVAMHDYTSNIIVSLETAGLGASVYYDKPFLLSEFDLAQNGQSVQTAGQQLQSDMSGACSVGFSGWAMWQWDDTIETGWSATTDGLYNYFSPVGHRQPCQDIPSGDFISGPQGSQGIFRSTGSQFCWYQTYHGNVNNLKVYPRIPADMVYEGVCQ